MTQIDSNIKTELYNRCFNVIENRYQTIQQTIADIQESLTSETKSTAGDKHETGRAMLQLEREKAGHQLAEIKKTKDLLSKIDISKTTKTIGLGSLVYTTNAQYFIAISIGEIKLNNEVFYAISPETPIAKLLIGKQVGDEFRFRDRVFSVLRIY